MLNKISICKQILLYHTYPLSDIFQIMKKFKRIYIEITNICNLHCSFCPDSGRISGFMTEDLFSRILDEIRETSEYIYLHVKGEPLMHPLLERFLGIACEKKFKVNLATNGTLIARHREMLLDQPSIRQISFSLHSIEDDLTGAGKYLDDIFSFSNEAINKTKMFIEFKLWNLNGTTENEINNIIFSRIESHFNLKCKVIDMVPSGKGIKISDRIFLNRDKSFLWPDLNLPDGSHKGFCYGLKKQAAILVDGTVVPCCLDGKGIINLGNIKASSFNDIINSERSTNMIRGFSERHVVEKLCLKCTYRDRFTL